MKPYAWQKPNVEAMASALERVGVVADTSGTGAGKTVMTCVALRELGLRAFVVCPKSVLPDWRETAEAVGIEAEVSNYEKLIRRGEPGHPGYWKRKKTTWLWDLPPGTALVFDEAHRLSGYKSQTSKLLKAAKDQGLKIVLLSATLADSPLKMRAIGYALDLGPYEWRAWQGWLLNNGCAYGDFNKPTFEGPPEFKESIMARMRVQAGERMTGVRTEDVPEFPKSLIMTRSIPTSTAGSKIDGFYSAVLAQLEATAELGITAANYARQRSEWGKKEAMAELAMDAHAEGNSVALFVGFRETCNWLGERLKAVQIHGDNSPEERQDAIERFQSNEIHFITCTLDAGGEAISLHDLHGRPRVTIISPTENPVRLIQALGRTPRAGALSSAVQYIVFAEGSEVEERVRKAVSAKTNNIAALTDNDLSLMDTPTQQPDHAARKHASVSPSSLKNREICAHWKNKEGPPHPTTIMGTRSHEALEVWLNTGKLPVEDCESEEEQEGREACVEYVEDVIGAPWAEFCDTWNVHAEPRLTTHEPNTFGFADGLLINESFGGNEGHGFDWKFGQNYQGDAEDNPQGQAYVLGAFLMWPKLERITIHFVYAMLGRVTRYTFTRDDIPALKARVSQINRNVEAAIAGKLAPHYDRGNCEWCGKRMNCEVWRAAESSLAETSGIPLPSTLDASLVVEPEDMGRLLNLVSYFEERVKEVKSFAMAMAEEGQTIPGWRVVEVKGRMQVVDVKEAAELAQGQGLTYDDILECAKLSGPQLAKKVRSKAETGKGAAEEAFRLSLLETGAATLGDSYAYLKRSDSESLLELPDGDL